MNGLRFAPHLFTKFFLKKCIYPNSNFWRLLYLFSFVSLITPSLAGAAQVSLSWEKSSGPDIAGYEMHYGIYSGNYQYSVDAGNSTNCTISGLNEGTTYYFAVTAYNSKQQESDYSNEVSYNSSAVFLDVPPGYWAEDAIHAIYNADITTGCSQNPMLYCPEQTVSRAAIAILLERGINGGSFTPPSATGIFDDVPVSYWASDWIEQLYADGITRGYSTNPLLYGPDKDLTRAAMAIFLLRVTHGANYTPPPAEGIFTDVPVTHWAADWIEQLYEEGITGGCKMSPLQYCPDDLVTRAAAAVFLSRVFGL